MSVGDEEPTVPRFAVGNAMAAGADDCDVAFAEVEGMVDQLDLHLEDHADHFISISDEAPMKNQRSRSTTQYQQTTSNPHRIPAESSVNSNGTIQTNHHAHSHSTHSEHQTLQQTRTEMQQHEIHAINHQRLDHVRKSVLHNAALIGLLRTYMENAILHAICDPVLSVQFTSCLNALELLKNNQLNSSKLITITGDGDGTFNLRQWEQEAQLAYEQQCEGEFSLWKGQLEEKIQSLNRDEGGIPQTDHAETSTNINRPAVNEASGRTSRDPNGNKHEPITMATMANYVQDASDEFVSIRSDSESGLAARNIEHQSQQSISGGAGTPGEVIVNQNNDDQSQVTDWTLSPRLPVQNNVAAASSIVHQPSSVASSHLQLSSMASAGSSGQQSVHSRQQYSIGGSSRLQHSVGSSQLQGMTREQYEAWYYQQQLMHYQQQYNVPQNTLAIRPPQVTTKVIPLKEFFDQARRTGDTFLIRLKDACNIGQELSPGSRELILDNFDSCTPFIKVLLDVCKGNIPLVELEKAASLFGQVIITRMKLISLTKDIAKAALDKEYALGDIMEDSLASILGAFDGSMSASPNEDCEWTTAAMHAIDLFYNDNKKHTIDKATKFSAKTKAQVMKTGLSLALCRVLPRITVRKIDSTVELGSALIAFVREQSGHHDVYSLNGVEILEQIIIPVMCCETSHPSEELARRLTSKIEETLVHSNCIEDWAFAETMPLGRPLKDCTPGDLERFGRNPSRYLSEDGDTGKQRRRCAVKSFFSIICANPTIRELKARGLDEAHADIYTFGLATTVWSKFRYRSHHFYLQDELYIKQLSVQDQKWLQTTVMDNGVKKIIESAIDAMQEFKDGTVWVDVTEDITSGTQHAYELLVQYLCGPMAGNEEEETGDSCMNQTQFNDASDPFWDTTAQLAKSIPG